MKTKYKMITIISWFWIIIGLLTLVNMIFIVVLQNNEELFKLILGGNKYLQFLRIFVQIAFGALSFVSGVLALRLNKYGRIGLMIASFASIIYVIFTGFYLGFEIWKMRTDLVFTLIFSIAAAFFLGLFGWLFFAMYRYLRKKKVKELFVKTNYKEIV